MHSKSTLSFRFLIIAILSCCSFSVFAQKGEIHGTVLYEAADGTKKPIDYLTVLAVQNGLNKGLAYTTDDGSFVIKPLEAGEYELLIKDLKYDTVRISGLQVSSDGARIISEPIILHKKSNKIREVRIVAKKVLIDVGSSANSKKMTAEEIKNAPVRGINDLVAAGTPGVYQDRDGGLKVKGDRGQGTRMYIDGIEVRGDAAIPVGSISETEITTGGIPAKYGDAIGGVINVVTKGASKKFSGGGEVATSKLLDPYGYYLGAINLTGPLLFRKDPGAKERKPLLGYNLSLEFQHDKDPTPSAIGAYKVNDATLSDIEQNPLLLNPKSGYGYIRSAEFVNANDWDKIKYQQNVAQNQVRIATKLDFNLNPQIALSVGGNGFYTDNREYVREYALFNSQNNPENRNYSWRVFARFKQSIGKTDTASLRRMQQSAVQNAYYTVQVDYSQDNYLTMSDRDKKNAFDYGYVGKFQTLRAKQFVNGTDSLTHITGVLQTFDKDTMVLYSPGSANPKMTNYPTQYFNAVGDASSNIYNSSISSILQGGGLINGQRPGDVNGLWYNTGRTYGGYNYSQNNQLRVAVDGSFDLKLSNRKGSKPHNIEFGLLYEQRSDRSYNMSAFGLWSLMRLLENNQLSQLDKLHPIIKGNGTGGFQDTVFYNYQYNKADQYNFDRNVRQALGMAANSTQKIDIDALDPNFFKLSMFSPDELLNNGNSYVSYNGYDYMGNVYRGTASFNDYFTKKDANGNYLRQIGANRPIYNAAYIQDKFYFNDLVFNVGLRIDRFDANTKVLKDPYSLYAIKSVGEVSGSQNIANGGKHPSNIGSDYAVYVDQLSNPATAKILGYRNGDNWYDANGTLLTDPTVLAKATATNNILPYLADTKTKITDTTFDPNTSFKDFSPQLNFSPRVAFNFPINNDEAMFFANYDVLVQRPQANNYITPDYYMFMDKIATDATFPNPNLLPERKIDYAIGYKQSLTPRSALTLTAHFIEYKDLIQITRLAYSYPVSYRTFGNRDFATNKGFDVNYEQIATKNLRLNVSYTLAFADGSGSDDRSQAALIDAGVPNLRTVMPLSYDVRHTIGGNMDFHFGSGDSYNGPQGKMRKILESAGFNVIFRARSGEPYSKLGLARGMAYINPTGFQVLQGSINGSRLPWNYNFDIKFDKNFYFKAKTTKKGRVSRGTGITTYITITNLLNTKNVASVYNYTGNPNDDGYLGSPGAQSAIANQNNPQGFIDQYRVKMDNPSNYYLPRRIRFGIIFNF